VINVSLATRESQLAKCFRIYNNINYTAFQYILKMTKFPAKKIFIKNVLPTLKMFIPLQWLGV
jgi:hypothetical protein